MVKRVALACSIVMLVSLSLAFSQSKNDCTAKSTSGSTSSCCMHGTKASLTSASKTTKDAQIVTVKDDGKECAMKGVKNASDCTAAEKANCAMSKASMTKAGTKADCCAGKAKGAKAKNTVKQTGAKIVEAKGTN